MLHKIDEEQYLKGCELYKEKVEGGNLKGEPLPFSFSVSELLDNWDLEDVDSLYFTAEEIVGEDGFLIACLSVRKEGYSGPAHYYIVDNREI